MVISFSAATRSRRLGACTGVTVVAGSRRARAIRRRKRRMGRVDHDLSAAQWIALKAAWGGCAYCGASNTPLQRDCVLALSRGGRYTLANIVPVCRSCNASSATPKSPAGCAAGDSTNAPSCCATLRSTLRSHCGSKGQTPSDAEEVGFEPAVQPRQRRGSSL